MKVCIDMDGDLVMTRAGRPKKACCPFDTNAAYCGDQCPLFDEVMDGDKTKAVALRCANSGFAYEVVEDHRRDTV